MWFRNELSSLAEVSLYLGTTITNQSCINEEIKSRLGTGNACYHQAEKTSVVQFAVQGIKKYRTIILCIVCVGVKNCVSYWGRSRGIGRLRIGRWGNFSRRTLLYVVGSLWQQTTAQFSVDSMLEYVWPQQKTLFKCCCPSICGYKGTNE